MEKEKVTLISSDHIMALQLTIIIIVSRLKVDNRSRSGSVSSTVKNSTSLL